MIHQDETIVDGISTCAQNEAHTIIDRVEKQIINSDLENNSICRVMCDVSASILYRVLTLTKEDSRDFLCNVVVQEAKNGLDTKKRNPEGSGSSTETKDDNNGQWEREAAFVNDVRKLVRGYLKELKKKDVKMEGVFGLVKGASFLSGIAINLLPSEARKITLDTIVSGAKDISLEIDTSACSCQKQKTEE